jgi:uncharacterized protein (DUF3084 family)
MFRNLSIFVLFAALCAGGVCAADQPGAAEAKLREAIRTLTLQLRDARNEQAKAQAEQEAAKTESDAEIAKLKSEIQALTMERDAVRESARKTEDDLTKRLQAQDAEVSRLSKSLTEWKAGHEKVTEFAKTAEAQRTKLASEAIVLKRTIADQQTKNAAMFKLGNEILVRYEKFGLGDALTAREPFVGTTRVKFQNLIQDYQDKLVDQKIKP